MAKLDGGIGGIGFLDNRYVNLDSESTNVTNGTFDLTTTGTLGAGAITGTSLTDGTATLDDGALTGITTIGMSGQLTNTLAIGTSPFVVTSTTVNTNLNADLLDGQHGTYYIDIVNDTTPQLGGNLDGQAFDITTTGDLDVTGEVNNDEFKRFSILMGV